MDRSWIPKDTPAPIVEKLNQEVNAALADATIRGRLADLGGVPLAASPADFGTLIAEIRAANIKPV